MKDMTPIQPKPPAKDESLQKLKSEIEILITSGRNYAYKSPEQEFEEHLTREFREHPESPSKIRSVISGMRTKDPLSFSTGKHYSLNYDALVRAKEHIRNEIDNERRDREERQRIEIEEQERKRQAKIQKELDKKLKRQPWLANSPAHKLTEEKLKIEKALGLSQGIQFSNFRQGSSRSIKGQYGKD